MHLDPNNRLHPASASASQCPHCGAHAQMDPVSIPDYMHLQRMRPTTVGIVYHCTACHAPVFRKHRVKAYTPEAIELQRQGQDVERRDDPFRSQYLPSIVSTYFIDAGGCYRAGLLQAFAAMCRLTIQAMISDSGERSDSMQLKLYDQFDQIAAVVKMDDGILVTVQDVLFDDRPETIYAAELDRGTAAILLEVMKDLLHQTYIRHGRLSKALRMRRFFANREATDDEFAAETDPDGDAITRLRPARRLHTGTNDS